MCTCTICKPTGTIYARVFHNKVYRVELILFRKYSLDRQIIANTIHISQNKAETSIRIWTLYFLATPPNLLPKQVVISIGGDMLKFMWTIRQIICEGARNEHMLYWFLLVKKKIIILLPRQFILPKLSFVRFTFWRNHINILICYLDHLFPTSAFENVIFRRVLAITSATKNSFHCTMLYNDGYWWVSANSLTKCSPRVMSISD